MIGWLKFYFLGFFNDKYGREGAARSFLNTFLSLIVALLLLCGGISAGYSASFSTHYENAGAFREFLYSSFSDGEGVSLTVKGGRLSAEIPGKVNINTFVEGEKINGYSLIVDTRPAETAFDDFYLVCNDADGNKISYGEFRALSAEDQKKYNVRLMYSGKPLDVTAKQSEYIAFLDKVSTEGDPEYNSATATAYGELKNKMNSGEITAEKYGNGIYILFAKAYYPDYSRAEMYGAAPTLRTYYMQADLTENADKYLILLDDLCLCAFKTEGGISVEFGSYYGKVKDGVITPADASASRIHENIDGFMSECFKSSSGFNFLVHLMNAAKFMILLAVAMILIALIVFIICKITHLELGESYFGSFKLTGGYLLYAAVVTFFLGIGLAFVLTRSLLFTVCEWTLVGILLVRALAFVIAELIRKRREPRETEETA